MSGIEGQVWSVYVLFSPGKRRTYVGCSHDVEERLKMHNAGRVRATKSGVPWNIMHSELVGQYADARRRESYYKSGAGRRKLKELFQ